MARTDAGQTNGITNKPPSRWHFLPPDTTTDARVLLLSRGVRAFTDGYVSVLLPLYLTRLGFDGLRIEIGRASCRERVCRIQVPPSLPRAMGDQHSTPRITTITRRTAASGVCMMRSPSSAGVIRGRSRAHSA